MCDADAARDLYARFHPAPHVGAEPHWGTFYKPSQAQKAGELAFVGGVTLGGAYLLSKVL